MKNNIIVLILLAILAGCSTHTEPIPFESDGYAPPPKGCVDGRKNNVDCKYKDISTEKIYRM